MEDLGFGVQSLFGLLGRCVCEEATFHRPSCYFRELLQYFEVEMEQ